MAGEFVESQVSNLHPLTSGGERMELSLDPKVTALVLIDLQRGIVGRQAAPHAAADVVRNGVRLADALRAKGGLVVFVRVNISEVLSVPVDAPTPRPANVPPDASELVPELNVQAGDVVVTKRQWGAFLRNRSGAAVAAAADPHGCDGWNCDEHRRGVDGAGGI
jgi:isochorismate hydrolase